MDKPENPPAFPVKVKRNTSSDPLATPREIQMEGMSLRDWFAGQALQAILMAAGIQSVLKGEQFLAEPIARDAYAFADALLSERRKS